MQELIVFLISNFTLTFFLISILCTVLVLLKHRRQFNKAQIIEVCFSYFILCNIGFSYFYNFVMHVFFGDLAAHFIGWANSPFQLEVGFASLGIAITGFISFRSNIAFRTATIIVPAAFCWGAAAGHIYQIIINHNYAPGNAGIMLWYGIIMPPLAFILLWLQYKNPIESKL